MGIRGIITTTQAVEIKTRLLLGVYYEDNGCSI